ncbi:hypothetical protein CCMA1212_004251, partial [Trichoderma ghanense]
FQLLSSAIAGQRHFNVFRKIAVSIILLDSHLSVAAPSQLHGFQFQKNDIYNKLSSLSSVLDVQSRDTPVKLFHLSYRDFLVAKDAFGELEGKETCRGLHIEEVSVHAWVAGQFLQLLSTHLHNDVCNLQDPGVVKGEVQQEVIRWGLPPAVAYACLYWIYHHIFLKTEVLNWVEALAWLEWLNEGLEGIRILEDTANKANLGKIPNCSRTRRDSSSRSDRQSKKRHCRFITRHLCFHPPIALFERLFLGTVRLLSNGCHKSIPIVAFTRALSRYWDLSTASCLHDFDIESDKAHEFAVSPGCKLAVMGERHVQIWSLQDRRDCLHALSLAGEYTVFDFLRRESKTVQLDRVLDMRNKCLSKDGKLAAFFDEHGDLKDIKITISIAIFYREGELLITGTYGGEIFLTNVKTGETEKGFDGQVVMARALAVSTNHERLVVGGGHNMSISIWDVKNHVLQHILTAHPARRFAPRTEITLASYSWDAIKIWAWPLATPPDSQTCAIENIRHVVLDSNGQTLYHSEMEAVGTWDVKTMNCVKESEVGSVFGIVLSDFSPLAAILGMKHTEIWDLNKHCRVQTLQTLEKLQSSGNLHELPPSQLALRPCAFSKNGQLFYSRSHFWSEPKMYWSMLQTWAAATGHCVRVSSSSERGITSIVMRPEGQQVALLETSDIRPHSEIGTADIRIQGMSTGRCICVIHTEAGIESAVFSAKGTQIIAITPTRDIGIFNTSTGAKVLGLSLVLEPYDSKPLFHLAPSFFHRELVVHKDMPTEEVRDSLLTEYGISPDEAWLTRRLKRVLWLPPEYRPSCAISQLILGCGGRVVTMVLESQEEMG